MSIAAGTVWEINASGTANNANGGGFNPTNANFATDLACDTNTGNTNSPVVSSASYNFVSADVGKWVYVKSGTNWTAGWYQIASVASNKATLSAAVGQAIQTDSTKGFPVSKYVTNTAAGCATVGTPTGGTWGIDHSQATAAKVAAATDLMVNAITNTVVHAASGSHSFDVSDVGNFIHITAGTGYTQGWYEIVSVSGGDATLDRSPGAVGITGGTYSLGGAISLNSSTTNQTDLNFFAQPVGGNVIFAIGSLTLAANPTMNGGGVATPIQLRGYVTNRATMPTGSNRPTINASAQSFSAGAYSQIIGLIFLGNASPVLTVSANGAIIVNCKCTNNSTTANRDAYTMGSGAIALNCEAISYRGRGFRVTAGASVIQCYVHDCDTGILRASGGAGIGEIIWGNIIESCVTAAINYTTANGGSHTIIANTLYGAENKNGTGLSLTLTATSNFAFFNNLIYGFATGVNQATSGNEKTTYGDFNDFYNNTTDRTNWPTASNDQALNPAFSSVSQVTGTAGKFAASNDRLIDTTKNFVTLGVVAGQDCVYIKSGSGITAGIYGVSSITTTTNTNDTLVLDVAPGTNTTADKTYQVTTGHNFAIGANLKALGFPGTFQASLTRGYMDIGAVQRQEPAGGLPMSVQGVV
jgi:hypothetical protein